MEIRKTKYTSAWIRHYADTKRKVFEPVIKGQKILRFNARLRFITWLFIIISVVITCILMQIHPERRSNYGFYIFIVVMASFTMIKESFLAYFYPHRREYEHVAKAFEAGINTLGSLYAGYASLETIINILEKNENITIPKAFQMAGINTEEGNDKDTEDAKMVDFTANDKYVEECVSMFEQLEKACKKQGLLK